MKYFVAFFFLFFVTTFSRADKAEDVNSYIDEVLSIHVPWAIEEAGIQIYRMPDFESNFQQRFHDGSATTGKFFYHAGSLTGLQTMRRWVCSRPEWTSGNSTFYCDIIYPEITVEYSGQVQILNSISNNVRFRQRQFSMKAKTTDMLGRIEVTASPYVRIPAITKFVILKNGKTSLEFDVLEEVSSEIVTSHFNNKFNKLFSVVYDEVYRKAFERGIGSLPFPF